MDSDWQGGLGWAVLVLGSPGGSGWVGDGVGLAGGLGWAVLVLGFPCGSSWVEGGLGLAGGCWGLFVGGAGWRVD